MDLGLSGRRVLVTDASKGIGRAIARTFRDEGAVVAICARGAQDLEAAASDLAERGEVHHRTCDMAIEGEPSALVEWAADAMGGLDVLVSNVSAMAGPDWEACANVDLVRTDELIRAALERMEDDVDANIVCIGSRAANTAAPRIAAYAAVKAATVSMVKSLSREVARRGIRANVVSPGDVIFPGGTWDRVREEDGKLWHAIVRDNPFRRLGTPEEIAATVAFVASPRSSFTTGANVMVDGGATTGLQI
ncbi:SDR family NAD(P)-dependent oxidoreductase [Ilumatobacter sp.]|uniref:SDR family NAD(P)-dependent oxidoreductase n=1 Tax=Ilumatobacter sp. TaxID=1967498 RepID=UPI003B51BE0E